MRFSNSNMLPTSFDCNGCVIGQRTESDRVANAIRSGGERNLIGWRTESDRTADGIRSDGGRKPIGWRVPSRGCTCLKCTNKAIKYPTKLSSTQQNCQVPNKTVKYPTKLSSAPISFL